MPSIPSPHSPREKDLMNISFLRAPDTHDARAKRLAATFYA